MENLSLNKIAELVKNRRVVVLIGFGAIVFLVWVWYSSTHHPTPTWNGLVPGTSNEARVKAVLGDPLRTGKEDPYIIYGYRESASEVLDEVWFKDNVVVLVKDEVVYNPNFTQDNLKKYGKPTTLYSKEFAQAQELLVFPDWGYAFLINKNKKTIEQTWYFKTTNLEQFKKDFGAKLEDHEPEDSH